MHNNGNVVCIVKRHIEYFMKILFVGLFFALVAIVGCQPSAKKGADMVQVKGKERAKFRIDSLETVMKTLPDTTKEEDIITVGMELGDAYQGYTIHYSADSLAPLYTMKLGQIYEHILMDVDGAEQYYQQAAMKYPDYALRDEVLFHLGNLLLSKNKQSAKNCFSKLIKEYPSSTFKKDAEQMLVICDDTSLNATIHRFEQENDKKKKPNS